MSIHFKLTPLLLAGALAACGGASAKLETGRGSQARFDDGPNKWEDGDAMPEGIDGDQGGGRRVEGHAWQDGEPTATLPGFRANEDGSSRVFLEVSGHVEVQENSTPGVLRYRFAGVRVPERVNTLSLPTLYFRSQVTHISVVQVGDDAELVIKVRQAVEPKVHLKRTDGGTVLSIDFPVYLPNSQPLKPGSRQWESSGAS